MTLRDAATACSKCGKAVTPAESLYTTKGDLVCPRCDLDVKADDAHVAAAQKFKAVAYGAPGGALLSFLFNPWAIVSIGAILGGVYIFRSLRNDGRLRDELHESIARMKIVAVLGMAMGLVSTLLWLARFAPKR